MHLSLILLAFIASLITLTDVTTETMQWLKLGENRLTEIPSKSLKRLTKLHGLDLRGNNISLIGKDAFAAFGHELKFLYLLKNR